MKKLILTLAVLTSANAFADNGNNYCDDCYHYPHPYPHYSKPYVIEKNIEDTCITKLSVCTAGQKSSKAFYEYSMGYINRVVTILSNGKVVKYSEKGYDLVHNSVDAVNLKAENADAVVGNTNDKVIDEKGDALKVCKSNQEVLEKTYGYCK